MGDAAANTILYQSSTVTITLDKQTLSDFLPPSTVAPIGPNRITTDAIDISLNNAHLGGQTLSGDIALGETSASLFPPLHAQSNFNSRGRLAIPTRLILLSTAAGTALTRRAQYASGGGFATKDEWNPPTRLR